MKILISLLFAGAALFAQTPTIPPPAKAPKKLSPQAQEVISVRTVALLQAQLELQGLQLQAQAAVRKTDEAKAEFDSAIATAKAKDSAQACELQFDKLAGLYLEVR